MPRVLHGVRVVDFTHVLSGPIATHYLALQGADVVKVESAEGDTMRNYGGRKFKDGMGPSFVSVNAGKRSIVLDLKREPDLQAARRLVAGADVVVENFRPGVMERLGLGYEACRALKPDVVFCSVSGFGQTGPLKANPAIDQIIQSMSGLMTLSGDPGTPSMRVGFPVVDTWTGLLSAFAIMGALLQRERTGEGQCIDVAMFDAAMVMMVSVLGPWLVAGIAPEKQGNRGYSQSPVADTFATADGEITLGVVRDDQFRRLCAVLERPDLAADTRYAERAARMAHDAALQAEVTRAFAARSAVEWERSLNEAGVPAGAVRSLPEAIALDHFDARGLKQTVPVPGHAAGAASVLNAGFVLAHDAPGMDRAPPRLGEHTLEILAELGYSNAEAEAIAAPAAA